MRIKKLELTGFKRFHKLTIDLGETPRKIVALVGPNGCGKSSVFDAFEVYSIRHKGQQGVVADHYYSKKAFSPDITDAFDKSQAVKITWSNPKHNGSKKSFLIRSAYRFTGKLNVTTLKEKSDILQDDKRPLTTAALDQRLTDNYERMYADYFTEVQQSDKTGKALKEELLASINNILSSVLDIKIASLGNIMEKGQGQLFFEKGLSKSFPYDNLSSGEKEVVDLALDLVVKVKTYDETVFCIDEPELHLNTGVQRKLLLQLEKLIPSTCQLWIATHSIGFLRALQEELRTSTQVIDFFGIDFDKPHTLKPMEMNRENWKRVFSTALEDLTGLVAPKTIIYCEGKLQPNQAGQEQGFDARVYNRIFGPHISDVLFLSSGGSTQPNKYSEFAISVFTKALSDLKVLLLKDKDIKSDGSTTTDADRDNWLQQVPFRRMLKRKEIENYLLDPEIVSRAYPTVQKASISGLLADWKDGDAKAIRGQVMKLCGVNTGLNSEDFMLGLASHVTPDTQIYKEILEALSLS